MVHHKDPHKSQKWIYKIKLLLIEQFIVSNLTFNVSQICLVDLGVTLNVIYIIPYFLDQLSVIFRSIHKLIEK